MLFPQRARLFCLLTLNFTALATLIDCAGAKATTSFCMLTSIIIRGKGDMCN